VPADRVRRRPPLVVEVVGLALWLVVFTWLHDAVARDVAVATGNALALQSAEHAAHLDVERAMNGWLAGNALLSQLATYLYRLYYLAVAGVLLWVWFRHVEVYRQVRRALVAMTVLVLPVYWAVPMSPPRFALPGVVDVVAAHDLVSRPAGAPGSYTAMPSLHVGWALWCAYALWCALRQAHPRLALLAWLFPLLMVADVLGTGNHYVFDVVGSVLLVALAVAVARLCGRFTERRPTRGSPQRRGFHSGRVNIFRLAKSR
jgi:hypothetical protein